MIHHVSREVRPAKLQECVRFYAVLGFQLVPVPPGIEGRALWLERSGTQIHLIRRDEAQVQSGHIGIVVNAYTETVEVLRSEGHRVDARSEHWGSARSYVRDPAGHLVELMAFAPGTPTTEEAGQ